MGWGTSWDKPKQDARAEDWARHNAEWPKQAMEELLKEAPAFVGVDLGSGDSQTVLTTFEDGKLKHRVIPQEGLYNNLKPTHDPYTNPNAYIYYECECGQILDPKTKRFAELNNCASNAGWKIRWGSQYYIPYCVECAKEKGIE